MGLHPDCRTIYRAGEECERQLAVNAGWIFSFTLVLLWFLGSIVIAALISLKLNLPSSSCHHPRMIVHITDRTVFALE